jgi:hypothetical protein
MDTNTPIVLNRIIIIDNFRKTDSYTNKLLIKDVP